MAQHWTTMAMIRRGRGRRLALAGTGALGSLALGSMALGAIAIGAVAIGKLMIKRAVIEHLEAGTVEIKHLKVGRLDLDS